MRGVIELSIILVSFNAREDLDRCLGSLVTTPPALPHEIIVVDNASTDGSVDIVRKYPAATLIEAGANLGFAAANNRGIRASRGALLLLLNSDTIVPQGAIDGLIAILRVHPEAAVAGPRLVDAAGQAELSFGPMLAPWAELRQRRLVQGLSRRVPHITRAVETMTRQKRYPDWVSGACLLVYRADAEAVGLLDERYFMYTEDVDFCAAIRARGRRILFTPDVEITHLRGRSAAAAPSATRAAYRRSHLAFYQKHHPRLAPFVRLYRALLG